MADINIPGFSDAAAGSDADLLEVYQPAEAAGTRNRKGSLAWLRTWLLNFFAPRRDAVTALSISSGTVNIDCSAGDFFTLALTANVTSITFSNLPAAGKGASLAIQIQQDGTGGRTVALPASFKATGGSDVAVQAAANARTLLTITSFDQGTRWEYAMQEIAA
jgi:hypothetical protein